ncbi:MAG: MlaC/ttg2D family ABC transporter substrate-binding protein [Janthinobacterium lividum]
MRFFKALLPVFVLGFILSHSIYCITLDEKSNGTEVDSSELELSKRFIEDTGNKIIQVLVNKSASLSQRQDQFRQVIREKFDMSSIVRYVLGRYWKKASPNQQTEYLKLFEDSIVESYSHQFDSYTNEKLIVSGARPSNKGGVIVTSKIILASGPPVPVDWKVFRTNGDLRILDVSVKGVSMSITYRSQYAGAYDQNGRSIEGLLKALRSKEITTDIPDTNTESPQAAPAA